jgi:hypothetical protein
MRPLRRSRLAVLLGLVVVAFGALWFVHGLSADRRDAQARWEEREPAAYSFSYGYCGGMCANCPVRLTVRDGEVTEATVDNPDCSAPALAYAPTIEDLFEIAEDHQPWPIGGSTSISYDDHWGFPTSIRFTCDEGVSDCGGGWSVSDFEVLS